MERVISAAPNRESTDGGSPTAELLAGDDGHASCELSTLVESSLGEIENLKAALHDFERRHIAAILAASGGDKVTAARKLGIGLSSLYRKLDGRNKRQGG